MTPDLATRLIKSLRALEQQADTIADRYSSDASALGKGTRRELSRMSDGVAEIRRALETETSAVVAGVLEVSDHERKYFDRLSELLPQRTKSWDEIGEILAAEGLVDKANHALKRNRLAHLAIAAAGGKRYACASAYPVTAASSKNEDRTFDLFNLPKEVGGAGNLHAIVRGIYDRVPRYEMLWRFATPSDLMTSPVVVDDDEDDDDETDTSTT